MKTFIHSGTQEIEFGRLLDFAIMNAYSQAGSKVVYQGYVANENARADIPENIHFMHFMRKSDFESTISDSDIVVCHGGTGAIFNSISLGHRPYVLPRLAKFGEHNDDHQLELFELLLERNLVLELPNDDSLVSTRNLEVSYAARKFFDGGLIPLLLDEIEEALKGCGTL